MKILSKHSRWLVPVLAILLGVLLGPKLLASWPQTPSGAIEAALNDCASQTTYVNHSNMSEGEKAVYLADQMQSLNLSDCPPDFQQAFAEHILAWRQGAPIFENNTSLFLQIVSTASEVYGDPTLVSQTRLKAYYASQRINDTYKALVAIATQHGARVPVSVVIGRANG
jgi:hypothetical protein